jgi:hypothetical protein
VTDIILIVAVAAVTVGSRVASTALLPPPRGAVAAAIARLPAPLFAALAALSLRDADAGTADPRLMLAVGCALVSTRWRSLFATVVAGLGGYLVADAVW